MHTCAARVRHLRLNLATDRKRLKDLTVVETILARGGGRGQVRIVSKDPRQMKLGEVATGRAPSGRTSMIPGTTGERAVDPIGWVVRYVRPHRGHLLVVIEVVAGEPVVGRVVWSEHGQCYKVISLGIGRSGLPNRHTVMLERMSDEPESLGVGTRLTDRFNKTA